jgi:hypothetical protein
MTVGGRTSAIINSLQILPDALLVEMEEKAKKSKTKKVVKGKGKRRATDDADEEEEAVESDAEEGEGEEEVDEKTIKKKRASPRGKAKSRRASGADLVDQLNEEEADESALIVSFLFFWFDRCTADHTYTPKQTSPHFKRTKTIEVSSTVVVSPHFTNSPVKRRVTRKAITVSEVQEG